MFKKLVLLVLLIIVCCETILSSCVASNEDYEIECTSLNDLSALTNHKSLKKLKLSNPNNIARKVLVNDAFRELPALQKLTIDGLVNEIEEFAFRGLSNLTDLWLIANPLDEIPAGVFNSVPNLYELFIIRSGIKTVSNNIFPNTSIAILDLSQNEISTIQDCAFCDMKNIYVLRLHINKLTSFEADTLLGPSPVASIALYNNKISTIRPFTTAPALVSLAVQNNIINRIEENSFSKCKDLQFLGVSDNRLEDIPASIFPAVGLAQPVQLFLHNNNLKCFSAEIRSRVKKLIAITLDGNLWECQCVQDVISWARGLNANVYCGNFDPVCTVTCMDGNHLNNITVYQ